MVNKTCTCKEWQIFGIPCEHACVVILLIGQNVFDFVDEWFTFWKQELIYFGFFFFFALTCMICQILGMIVWFELLFVMLFSLCTLHVLNDLPKDLGRSVKSLNSRINELSIVLDVIWWVTIVKLASIH